jgi:hypothetical protein
MSKRTPVSVRALSDKAKSVDLKELFNEKTGQCEWDASFEDADRNLLDHFLFPTKKEAMLWINQHFDGLAIIVMPLSKKQKRVLVDDWRRKQSQAAESTNEPVPEDTRLRDDIESAINRVSAENGSNTPDFILAQYLIDCLAAYDRAVMAREKWYGREPKPASGLSCGCEGGICEHQPPPPNPVGKPFFTSI